MVRNPTTIGHLLLLLLLSIGGAPLSACDDSSADPPQQDGPPLVDAASDLKEVIGDQGGDVPSGPAEIKFGAIADIHADGEYQLLQGLVDQLVAADVEFFVVLGDLALNGALRGIEEKTEDRLEIIDSLDIIAAPGLPVYVLAGNHETHTSYESAMADLQPRFSNIIDLAPLKVVEHQGLVLAGLSGSHTSWVVPAVDGYLYGAEEVNALAAQIDQHEGPVVLLTHDPPLTAGAEGIDYVEGSGNVGDPALSALIEKHHIGFSLSGHIHFSTPRAVDQQNNPVAKMTWSEHLYLNVGAADRGVASLVTYREGQMMFSYRKEL